MTSLILLSRLRRLYWPAWCSHHLTCPLPSPVSRYVPEPKRTQGYDAGRIRYFMDELQAGRPVDPIVIDNGPTVNDGHHRLVAAVRAGRQRIPAWFIGPERLGKWLSGGNQ